MSTNLIIDSIFVIPVSCQPWLTAFTFNIPMFHPLPHQPMSKNPTQFSIKPKKKTSQRVLKNLIHIHKPKQIFHFWEIAERIFCVHEKFDGAKKARERERERIAYIIINWKFLLFGSMVINHLISMSNVFPLVLLLF